MFPLLEVPSEGYRKSYIETFYILNVGRQQFQGLSQGLKNKIFMSPFKFLKRSCLESKQWASRLILL